MYVRRRPWRRLLDLTVTQTYFRLPLDLPSDYIYPCTTHTYTYIYTRVAQPHDLLLFGGAYWVRCFLPLSSAKLPRPWTLPTRPPFTFSPSPREQRTTLRATRHRVTLSLSLYPTGESGLGFSSTFFRPKQHRSSFYEEEAGKETFLLQRENCNAVKSGRARVEKALEREEKKG